MYLNYYLLVVIMRNLPADEISALFGELEEDSREELITGAHSLERKLDTMLQ